MIEYTGSWVGPQDISNYKGDISALRACEGNLFIATTDALYMLTNEGTLTRIDKDEDS